MKIRSLFAVSSALTLVILISGCMPKDEGTKVGDAPKPDPAAVQKQMDQIRSNPNIPQSQKDAILGRLQTQLGSSGSTEAGSRDKMVAKEGEKKDAAGEKK